MAGSDGSYSDSLDDHNQSVGSGSPARANVAIDQDVDGISEPLGDDEVPSSCFPDGCGLEEMVVSGDCPAGVEKQIWESVVDRGERLHGNWDESAAGAFSAARTGDWAVCTYLAARCFMKNGAESYPDDVEKAAKAGADALSVTISEVLDAVWVWAVSPIVLNIPCGHERLWLHVEGSQAAVWTEIGIRAYKEWFQNEGLRSSELPLVDHAVTERQRNAMMIAGEWNLEKLVLEKHIFQAEWISSDRIAVVGDNNLRVLTNAGWAAASFAGGAQGSAEHFSVGKVLELSQLKWCDPKVGCFVLKEGDRVKLRDFVSGSGCDAKECSFLGEDARLGHVRGGCFQVLAYPLGGDFTKALLRPVERVWSEHHKAAVVEMMRSFGACLVTTFAKAGKWSLVDLLLSNGVKFPKIDEEFSDVCGNTASVKRHWMRDLAKGSGAEHRSLFEMAFDAPAELRSILETLQQSDLLPDLSRCCAGQTSLIHAAAKAGRWDIAKMLLELGSKIISVASLLNSPALMVAPRACQELVHLHSACATRAPSLKEYFERMAGGENMNCEVLPPSWVQTEDCFLKREQTVVFSKCMWLGGTSLDPSSHLVFVRLSQDGNAADRGADKANEALVAAADALDSADNKAFRISMSQDDNGHPRRAFLQEPEAPGLWLALVCLANCVKKDNLGRLLLHVPMNSVPYPIIPRVNARIVVKTPCCQKPLKGVLLHVNGKPAGLTNNEGCLYLELPIGHHKLSAPYQSSDHKVIQVKKGHMSKTEMFISGAFYLFLQDILGKTAVKVTTNRYEVLKASNILPFVGEARLCGDIHDSSQEQLRQTRTAKDPAFGEVLRVVPGTMCGQQLPIRVTPHASCGTDFEPTYDADEWFQEYSESDCAVALLFGTQRPMTLGYLTPANCASPFSACPPLSLPANNVEMGRLVTDARSEVFNVRRASRSSGRISCDSANTRRSVPHRGRSASSSRLPKPLRPGEIGNLRRGEIGAGLRTCAR